MSDATIFVFGVIATLFTLGPLTIAAISEGREKRSRMPDDSETGRSD